MKVFITGATGYIGNALTQKLLEQGYHVHALVRTNTKQRILNHPNLHVFSGELSDRNSIDKAIEGCNQVYHLAAYAKPWAKDPNVYFEINVQGTLNIIEASIKAGVEKLVYSSSCAVFGRSNGSPVRETHIRDIDFFSEYESSKHLSEAHLKDYVNKGLNAVIVAPSKVYGPGLMTESNAVSNLINLYRHGNWHFIPGNGKSIGCYCFIDDVVKGHLLAMEYGRSGEKYILGGSNLTFDDLFAEIRSQTGKNHFLIHVPLWLMLIFGLKEELKAYWFNKEPLITRKWIRKYNYDLACACDKAINELGYQVTPFTEGLQKTVNWLKAESTKQ